MMAMGIWFFHREKVRELYVCWCIMLNVAHPLGFIVSKFNLFCCVTGKSLTQ